MTNKDGDGLVPRASTTERRAQIVDALARLVLERPFADISVAELAGEAGLATGLVHYHFDSKRAVLLALVDRVVQAYTERLAGLHHPSDAPVHTARSAIRAALGTGEGSDAQLARVWVALGAEATRSADVAAAMAPALDAFEGLLVGAFRHAALPDPESAAVAVLSACEGVGRLASVGRVAPGSGESTVLAVFDALLARGADR